MVIHSTFECLNFWQKYNLVHFNEKMKLFCLFDVQIDHPSVQPPFLFLIEIRERTVVLFISLKCKMMREMRKSFFLFLNFSHIAPREVGCEKIFDRSNHQPVSFWPIKPFLYFSIPIHNCVESRWWFITQITVYFWFFWNL